MIPLHFVCEKVNGLEQKILEEGDFFGHAQFYYLFIWKVNGAMLQK
ncbi:hypothetical protein HBN50_16590 [Halobacteriovorax sp. GB3]|nr:hypothetical protein [Halobacteriovorax sp. GB3]MDD0854729.1 hypothetical protein [Halobacteriovorax sp. GB3]